MSTLLFHISVAIFRGAETVCWEGISSVLDGKSTKYREVRNKLSFVSFTWIQFLLYLLFCFYFCCFLFSLARATSRVGLTLKKANNLFLTLRPANIMEAPVWFPALSWFFTALGIVGNSFVILLITSKKQLIHQTTNWFLLSLSFADLGVSLSIIPGEFFCFPSKRCHFVLLASFQWAFLYASVVNLCMLTLDRYIAIVKPFIYVLMMSKSRVVVFICAAWIFPFTFCFIPFAFIYSEHHLTAMRDYTYFLVFALEFLPVFILILATGHMIFIARKHAREVASVAAQLQYNQPTAEGGNVAPLEQENRRRPSVLFIAAIVFFFVFCYSVTIAVSFCSIFKLCAVPRALALVKKLLLVANSAFNPFVYGFLKHDVKKEVKQLLRI